MSRDKQIEEMAKYCCHPCELMEDDGSCYRGYDYKTCLCAESAKALYNAGYRKASDVAREIFEEIRAESSYCVASQNGVEIYHTKLYNISAIKLAELKKKYESEEK